MWKNVDVEALAQEQYVPVEPSTKEEIEELVIMVRLELYNTAVPCGPQAIQNKMEGMYHAEPLPSARTIARILVRNGLTHRRTGWYP